jgi:hypothetical protein
MHTLTNEQFFAWADGKGIGLDEKYPDSGNLAYRQNSDYGRFWVLPQTGELVPFIHHLFAGMDAWSVCYLWFRGGRWPEANAEGVRDAIRELLFRGLGIPAGLSGALAFDVTASMHLFGVLLAQLTLAWHDDLFVIPDHGRQFLHTDHHDVVHAYFAEKCRIAPFVEHMAAAGFDLPTDIPDWTFKRPSWMEDGEDGADQAE